MKGDYAFVPLKNDELGTILGICDFHQINIEPWFENGIKIKEEDLSNLMEKIEELHKLKLGVMQKTGENIFGWKKW